MTASVVPLPHRHLVLSVFVILVILMASMKFKKIQSYFYCPRDPGFPAASMTSFTQHTCLFAVFHWLHFCYFEISTLFPPSEMFCSFYEESSSSRCYPGGSLLFSSGLSLCSEAFLTPSLLLYQIAHHSCFSPTWNHLFKLSYSVFPPTSSHPPFHTLDTRLWAPRMLSSLHLCFWYSKCHLARSENGVNTWWVKE